MLELPFSGFATDVEVCCIPLGGTDGSGPELTRVSVHKNWSEYTQ